MPFDPSKPFEAVESRPAFDESAPFEAVAVAEFDPSQPFEPVEEPQGVTATAGNTPSAGPVGAIPAPATYAGAVAGAMGQKPRLGPEEPSREELAQLPPWDTRRIKAAESLSDLQALETEAQRRPLVEIPKPEGDAMAGVRAVIGAAEGMGTPENIGMLATGALAAPLGVMRPISAYFAATMGKEAAGGAVAAAEALAEGDLTKAGEELATAGTMGLMAVGAGAHAIGETRGAATVRERAETSAITEATKLREEAAVTDAQRQTDARLDAALAEAEKLAEPKSTAREVMGEEELRQRFPSQAEPPSTTVETPGAPGIAGEKGAPAVEPAPSTVGEHLKTDKAVQAILDEQPAATADSAMKAPEIPTEGGAAGGTGGKRTPPPKPIGDTPRGDKNWLRIPPWFKRIGKGLFTEGARHVLERTKNQVGKALAKATRRHVDVEQELFGQHEKILRDAVSSIPKDRQEALWTEVSQHVRDLENGRPTTPLAPDAQRVLDAWYKVGESTGDIARANNVQVWDANLGAYRPMGTVKNYIPRMFSREVEAALRDPEKNPALFNNLAQAIATHRGIALDAAAKELNKVAGRFSSNDFHGNLELARLEQLPEIFYEYDLRNLATRYLPAFSERMGQIIAYGQRLGPREQPSRMNLWDIARREARDETTQQWLNAAEDQATGFRPKNEFERNARRLQAIGNATLLSDPTTTVVRNLLSGLSVTAERFGVARAFKSLREAARSAAGLDAREIGALRDDIGSFLGAEQLGDSALDNAIRGAQQKALKIAGFSGSENFVRRHGAMTASAFARDAANALTTNPNSRLAKEALRYFKSLDVDAEAIVAEGGNWKTGPETRKFIRSSLRESQGGYRFDQVPIWAGSTVGRFLYQYGRWGIQRAGDIFRNTIRPAIGEQVEFRGKKMTHRNVLPLMRLGMLTVGLGEGFAAIAATLFGRDRRDASLSEIGEALDDDEQQAVALMGERIINDVLMAGTLGLIGQPVDYFKALKDQTRIKNPLDPPSIAGVKTVVDLATKAKDQGGTLTKRDLLDAATGLARGPKNVTDVARNIADEKLYEAQNDQRTLRNAARRWAKTQGMDVASKITFDTVRKSLNAPVFEAINDALLSGDAAKARQLKDEFIAQSKDKKKARTAVLASAEGRHPFRAGPFTSDKYRKQFMEWAEKNLGADDMTQIRRVVETYDRTRKDAGL